MMEKTKKERITDSYKISRIMTAGRLQTIIMLVDKARTMLAKMDFNAPDESSDDIMKCQNIIAQLEMALNFRGGKAAPDIFQMYEQIYTSLQAATPNSLHAAKLTLDHFRDTLRLRFRQ
ncbi:flagellar protein FliS [Fibrobacterota bacterium]